ncbi:MAG: hypothetical protein ABL307_16375 [Roseitalea porphyridii]|uniref:hypothetical protein n=1 Tax=Roseitalea porphyridii TaxID=1852022 RepID=UPI0032D8ECCD
MSNRLVHADNQICYRALCGMEAERAGSADRRAGIVALAMRALRRVSRKKGCCIDCPYSGRCAEPDADLVVDAALVDTHVTLNPVRPRSAH